MDLFNLPLEQFQRFIVIFIRTGAILGLAPFFGSRNVPGRVKTGLAFFISVSLYPFVDFQNVQFPSTLLPLGVLLMGEILIGIVIGYAARLFFTAVQIAGHLMGFQIGFAIVNVMDPQTSSQVSIVAQFENIVTMLFFLATGAYYMFLRAMAESFALIPPFGFSPSPEIMEAIMIIFSHVYVIAIKLSAPVLASALFTSVALGLVARTVPQINIFIVGMPVQIGIGLFMIGVTLTYIAPLLRNTFGEMEASIFTLLRAM